jgi:hemoglobin
MKTDITTRDHIEILVNEFYDKVRGDELLAPVFSHVNWPHHLPIMYNFWSSMLLGDQSYRGNPFAKHLPLPIGAEHFDQWLKLFRETVQENFEGQKAEEVLMRAESIAGIFQARMGITPSPR